jgi:hypothetical protein
MNPSRNSQPLKIKSRQAPRAALRIGAASVGKFLTPQNSRYPDE